MKKRNKISCLPPACREHPFEKEIEAALERGETLDQLAERIDKENTPDFYGAEFRRAYSEGLAAGSAYGYEQPLDVHDAMRLSLNFLNSFPQKVESFKCSEEVTEEAEFEVVEEGCLNPNMESKEDCEFLPFRTVEVNQEPAEDIILTPLGEMTFAQWDGYLAGLSEEDRKQFEAPNY